MAAETSYLAHVSHDAIVAKLDGVLKRLRERAVQRGAKVDISERELTDICFQAAETLLEDPVCIDLDLKTPLCIVGDIFGQYSDLLNIFEKQGYPPKQRYLFLGNYCDRGHQPIEVISLLFTLKLKYPKHIFLLRGNHECEYVSCHYGFLAECLKRYTKAVWHAAMNAFNCLPAVALIEDCIFCAHSGIVPCVEYTSTADITQLRYYITDIIRRPISVTENFLLTHLTWSEPIVDLRHICSNPSGLGQWFNEKTVVDFCDRFGFQLVIRSHDYMETGYEFMADEKLLTIFSASQLSGIFKNVGAVAYLQKSKDEKAILSRIKVIRPANLIAKASFVPLVLEDSLAHQEFRQQKHDALAELIETFAGSRGKYTFLV